jgi:hypothetical protein
MDFLNGLTVGQLTPSVLLGITVLMLLKGWLVPRSTLQDKIKEADQWHQAYELEREARNTSEAQNRELLEVAKTSAGFLKAVSDRAGVTGGA